MSKETSSLTTIDSLYIRGLSSPGFLLKVSKPDTRRTDLGGNKRVQLLLAALSCHSEVSGIKRGRHGLMYVNKDICGLVIVGTPKSITPCYGNKE